MHLKLIPIILATSLLFTGCAGNITHISDNYAKTSVAAKDFALLTSKDWLFGSGIVRGAIPHDALPAWVFSEMDKVDAWFGQGELTELQLGYVVGLKLRMTGPILEAAIRQHAPGILIYPEVLMVLQFVGL